MSGVGWRVPGGRELSAVLVLVLVCAPNASAQDPGVDVDPAGEVPAVAPDAAEDSSAIDAAPSDAVAEPPEASDEDRTSGENRPDMEAPPPAQTVSARHAPATRPARGRPPSSTRMHFRARHDMLIRWAPRYRLVLDPNPLGLEQQMWRRIEVLPMYHRVSLDVSDLVDGHVSLHFAGWGALDLFADSDGGVGAGDVAIAYVDARFDPVTLWVGRRFLTYGPPGGMHVDGGGAIARLDLGVFAEVFVGRPVTPTRTILLGPRPSFQGAALSYGARIGYSDPGRVGLSVAYTESWGHGIVGSRALDSVGYWYPGEIRFEGALKLDMLGVGVLSAQLTARWRPVREVDLDVGYAHLEPGRWIPRWSILSVFETSTYDELVVGGTWRPIRRLALRLVASGRRYDRVQSAEPDLGYRVALYTRVTPLRSGGPRLRVVIDRRDDGVIGFTILQAGVALDLIEELGIGLDGSFAIDDAGQRESALGRVSGDYRPASDWTLGLTLSLARTPIAPAEIRALVRARWSESS